MAAKHAQQVGKDSSNPPIVAAVVPSGAKAPSFRRNRALPDGSYGRGRQHGTGRRSGCVVKDRS